LISYKTVHLSAIAWGDKYGKITANHYNAKKNDGQANKRYMPKNVIIESAQKLQSQSAAA
jgi:hypothetical protein